MTAEADMPRQMSQVKKDVYAVYDLVAKVEKTQRAHGRRLGKVERSLSAVREGQGEHAARLDGIDGRLEGVDGRLERVDGRLDAIDGRLGLLAEQMAVVVEAVRRPG